MVHEAGKLVAAYRIEDTKQRQQFQQEYTLSGFRSLILINGGAVLALLTYAGNLSDAGLARSLTWSMAAYLAGMLFAVLAHLSAYTSQNDLANSSVIEAYKLLGLKSASEKAQTFYDKRGGLLIATTIALVIASLISFAPGSYLARDAIIQSANAPASKAPERIVVKSPATLDPTTSSAQ